MIYNYTFKAPLVNINPMSNKKELRLKFKITYKIIKREIA